MSRKRSRPVTGARSSSRREAGDTRVAFPAISTGIYAYPLDQAARVAIDATRAALEAHPDVEEARFWLFDDRALRAFEAAL